VQKARPGAVCQRLLRDQLWGKFVIEIRDQHATDYRDPLRYASRVPSPLCLIFNEIWIVSARRLLVLCECRPAACFLSTPPKGNHAYRAQI
jgi:hypothetical protein